MQRIESALLEYVVGGGSEAAAPNITRVKTQDSEIYTARTNWAYCADKVKADCDELSKGSSDRVDKKASAACSLVNQPKSCPLPLSGGGG